jgi:hypothetical protein
MDDPAHPDKPQDARENEMHGGDQDASLHKLAETGDEETANRSDYISRRPLTDYFVHR